MKQVETGRVGSTDGRPDEFVWELGFLLEAQASTGSGIDLRDRKTNNADLGCEKKLTSAGGGRYKPGYKTETKYSRLHELDSDVGILIGPSNFFPLTFDASLSESSVEKRGCDWGWRADFRFSLKGEAK